MDVTKKVSSRKNKPALKGARTERSDTCEYIRQCTTKTGETCKGINEAHPFDAHENAEAKGPHTKVFFIISTGWD